MRPEPSSMQGMQQSRPGPVRSSDSLIRKSAGVLIGLGLLAWLLSQVDLEDITNMIAQTDLRWFAVGCLAYLVSSLLRAYRFVQLTHSPLERISDMAVVVVAMSLANQILPARLGELSYVYLARRTQGLSFGHGLASLLIARLFDLLAIGLLYLLAALPLLGQLPSENLVYLWATAGTTTLVVVILAALATRSASLCGVVTDLLERPLLARLPGRSRYVRLVKNIERNLGWGGGSVRQGNLLLTSLAVWLSTFGMQFFVLLSLNVSVTFWHTVIGATFAALTSILPVNAIGNFGTLEAGWTAGFVLVGMDPSLALTTGFATHLLTLAYPIMFGLPAWGWVALAGRKQEADHTSTWRGTDLG